MPSRLSIYNGALTVYLGEQPLEGLTDDVPVRYALDGVWDRDGLRRCLQLGQWNFAARSARLDYDPSITPLPGGYRYAFPKPSDFVRTMGVHSDPYFKNAFTDYIDELSMWWCDLQELYVRYVSNDAQYGLDLSKWPPNFTAFVEGWFASQVTALATYSSRRDDLQKETDKLLLRAQSTDAMEQPSKSMPRGSWSRARGGRGGGERGSSSSLIG